MIQTATHPAIAALTADPMVLTGAVIIVATLLIAAAVTVLIKRSAARQFSQLAQHLQQLQEAVAAADARVAALAECLDERARTAQGASPTSYNVAIRLARSGASRQELMSTCGVTQQEADLVLRLHGGDPGMRSAA
jgi:Flp pilus assembly protein TadB